MAWRSARAHSCAARILVLPSRASSPICPNETIRSGLIQASGNFRTRAHEPEILNILNWPEIMLSVMSGGDSARD